MHIRPIPAVALASLLLLAACATLRTSPHALPPAVIPHDEWEASPPLGHAADAARRNLRAGDSLRFGDVTVRVLRTSVDSGVAPPVDLARIRLTHGGLSEEREVREGSAFNWQDHDVAIVAIYGPGELGAGLTAIEIATWR